MNDRPIQLRDRNWSQSFLNLFVNTRFEELKKVKIEKKSLIRIVLSQNGIFQCIWLRTLIKEVKLLNDKTRHQRLIDMFGKIPVDTLARVSVVGGIAAVLMKSFVEGNHIAKTLREPYCRESLKLLRDNEAANHILGKGFEAKVLTSHPDQQHFFFSKTFWIPFRRLIEKASVKKVKSKSHSIFLLKGPMEKGPSRLQQLVRKMIKDHCHVM